MPILPELLELLEGMSEREQAALLNYLRQDNQPIGELGELFIAQTQHVHLPTEDMREMLRVIEEDCEIVDETPPIVLD